MLNITDRKQQQKIFPLFRLAFRCFFWGAASYAVLAMLLWLWVLNQGAPAALNVPPFWWHAHEMFFGFALAVVIGFLLTGVQNWTGIPGTQDKPLMALFALWVLARLCFWIALPWYIPLILESLLLLSVCAALLRRVWRNKSKRNYQFVPLLLILGLLNIASYLSLQGIISITSSQVWIACTWWFMLLISIMGGRVIPFFSAKKIGYAQAKPLFGLEVFANGSLVVLILLALFPLGIEADTRLLLERVALIIGGLAQMIKLLRWGFWKCTSEPLLWSLHLFYAAIPLGLLARAWALPYTNLTGLLHLLTIGALSGVILSMVARVSLGHSGRDVYMGPPMGVGFWLLVIACLSRSLSLQLAPELYAQSWYLAGLCWCLSFGLYLLQFSSMLWKPRADGYPG